MKREEIVEVVKNEISKMEQWALAVEVRNKEDYSIVQDGIRKIKEIKSKWQDYWRPLKESAYKTWKEITGKEKQGLDIIDKAIRIATQKALAWYQEEEKKRIELQRKLQAEAEEKARKEKERLLKKAEAIKSPEKAEVLIQQAESITPPIINLESQTKVEGVSVRKIWYAELVNLKELVKSASDGNEVALSFLSFNEKVANQFARATWGKVNVPGVKFLEKQEFIHRKEDKDE